MNQTNTILKEEIFHSDNLDLTGSGYTRKAVRAVIIHKSQILLIHSPVNGDYKFPGGGIKNGETCDLALKREVAEECGLHLKSINSLLGIITEYNNAKEPHLDYFKMESFYYYCTIESTVFGDQNLDQYEKDLDFRPEWISLKDAINKNKAIICSGEKYPPWTKRETLFLEYLGKDLFK